MMKILKMAAVGFLCSMLCGCQLFCVCAWALTAWGFANCVDADPSIGGGDYCGSDGLISVGGGYEASCPPGTLLPFDPSFSSLADEGGSTGPPTYGPPALDCTDPLNAYAPQCLGSQRQNKPQPGSGN